MIDTKHLRQKILDLAVRGKLVSQDPNDEPASVLLERVRVEKQRMVAEGKLKRRDVAKDSIIYVGEDSCHYEKVGDAEPACVDPELPFDLPEGWEWARLGSIAYVASGSTPPKSAFSDEGIPYYKMYNLRNNQIDFDYQPQFISEEYHRGKLAKSIIYPGDLIMNIVGPPLGKLAIAPLDYPEANTNQAAVVIRPHGGIVLAEWIRYHLMEMSEINRITTRGSAGQVNISLTQSKLMRIPVPPLAEQRRIVAALDELLGLVDEVERSQAELEGLLDRARAKVLDLAIRGRLVPQDPSDEPAEALLARVREERLLMAADGRLRKRDVEGDSVIFRGEDNSYYERFGDDRVIPIEGEVFAIPRTWAWSRFGAISNYGSSESVNPEEIDDENWVLDLEDIEKGSGRILRRVCGGERRSSSVKRPFCAGQLLYSKLRPYLNKVLIAPEPGYCTSEIIPIELCGKVVPSYIRLVLMSDYFLSYANRCSYGVKMPRLGTRDGQRALLPIPPSHEQERIASAAETITTLLAAVLTM